MNYMDTIITLQQREFINKKDNVIKDALIRVGVDINNIEFLKNNLTRMIKGGDEFDHFYLYYGTEKQVRIISMQKVPDISNNQDDRQYKITATCKYY